MHVTWQPHTMPYHSQLSCGTTSYPCCCCRHDTPVQRLPIATPAAAAAAYNPLREPGIICRRQMRESAYI
jgi:hypothetical protein